MLLLLSLLCWSKVRTICIHKLNTLSSFVTQNPRRKRLNCSSMNAIKTMNSSTFLVLAVGLGFASYNVEGFVAPSSSQQQIQRLQRQPLFSNDPLFDEEEDGNKAATEMSASLPFLPRPKLLDGSLAGDVGFEYVQQLPWMCDRTRSFFTLFDYDPETPNSLTCVSSWRYYANTLPKH